MRAPPSWILASGSPRRRELLARILGDFQIIVPEVDEWEPEEADPAHQVEENARHKGQAVAQRFPDSVVIASDTTVALGKRIYGKPADAAQALAMLMQLAGKTHRVLTGVALLRNGTCHYFHDTSEVTFRPFDEKRAREYIRKVHVHDKAGAYAIQEHGDLIIARFTGSFENIMGLPVQRLRREFVKLGYGEYLIPDK